MKYIDVHGHLNLPDYDTDKDEVIRRAQEAGVGMITVGVDIESSKKAVELAQTHENIWATVGIHPTDSGDSDITEIEELAKDPKVVAIGECGLDYYHAKDADMSRQRDLFEVQIELANRVNKPLMLHVRNKKPGDGAYREVVDMLKMKSKVRSNFHFFAGTLEDMEVIVGIGGFMSFTGVITFTHNYDGVIKRSPMGSIMSETDCPFVAPASMRGKRCEPMHVIETIKAIALIRGEAEDVVSERLVKNARGFFGI